ncbi:MAG TPA: ATP-dependent Clp protease ATP-binding subunit [Pseudonocardiaceae bacterium]|nr:ATP-dependent Clp protease ATP-binding subunit [Pseudonocardiaceae bacterium]
MTEFPGSGQFGPGPFDDFLSRFFGTGAQGQPMQWADIVRVMSEPARTFTADAAAKAAEWGDASMDTHHLLWAATKTPSTRQLLAHAGADPDAVANAVTRLTPHGEAHSGPVSLTPAAKRVLLSAYRISRATGESYLGPAHILLAMSANPDSAGGNVLREFRITPDALRAVLSGAGGPNEPERGGDTPTLDQFGQDLTEQARQGRIDPVIGRDDEIEQTIEVLSRRTKNNPVLIGDAGVGKTAIVEGLAQRIADDDVPDTLAGRRLVQLDLTAMVAGTRYRGDFEERIGKVIDEIRANSERLIVFIDELHTMVAAGGAEGAAGAGNVLKPALARGELHVVGATTLDEYRRDIESDAALERRFQPILVPEPTVEQAVAILRGLRDRYEAHHQVRYADEALVAAVELADRYVTDRFLPDKAIDLIDQAGARVALRTRRTGSSRRQLEQRLAQLGRDKDQAVADEQFEQATTLRDQIAELRARLAEQTDDQPTEAPEVGIDDIAEVVSRATHIPVTQLTEEEKDRLLRLENRLHERVVGQDEAVAAVAEAVRRSRVGLGDRDRPVGSFLFLGPTGVGKTELARALADALFGDDQRMVRVDMSEFGERHTVSRLVGAPPGYVGYEEAGQLTEAVRRKPYSVVLLDEIEKAHSDVFNLLLQVLDDGRLTDGQGRTVDFRNTVLIMTSNVGSDLITGGAAGALGFAAPGEEATDRSLRERVTRRLRETFRPEFLNRIDDVIVFRRLEKAQLRQITNLLLEETRRRAHAQHVTVDFEPAAVDWIAEHGYQPEFGARPLRRTIQREVDNRLSRLLLDGGLTEGTHAVFDVRDGDLVVT